MKNILTGTSILILLLLAFAAYSCKNPAKPNSEKPATQQSSDGQPDVISGNEKMKRGLEVYNNVCLICHQEDGSGVPMMFPPINESLSVSGDPEKLIRIVLEGMAGPIEVKGEEYDEIMPPQAELSDQEISDLLTWLRNSFNNSGDAIAPEEVAKLRK